MKGLRGKTAIATSAGSGIGSSIAEVLAGARMKIAVADIAMPEAERVASRINAADGKTRAIQVDVSDRASVQAGYWFPPIV